MMEDEETIRDKMKKNKDELIETISHVVKKYKHEMGPDETFTIVVNLYFDENDERYHRRIILDFPIGYNDSDKKNEDINQMYT